MERNIKLRFRLWVDIEDTTFLGTGRIVLLEMIRKHGSITKGAEAINMSYRKAWQLVEDMNKCAREPLVVKRLGGKEGGGAYVTPEGERIISAFHRLQEEVDSFLKQKLEETEL